MGKTGYDYAPSSKTLPPVVGPGEFIFSVTGLDHGHIFGQANGLIDAGGTLKYVYDPDPKKLDDFLTRYPQAQRAGLVEEILADEETMCVASANVPCDRGPLGVRVMEAGKHYFTDKSPFTTLAQLEEARTAVAATGKRYMVYFSERLHNESSVKATELIRGGAIGEVLQVINLAPHRMSKGARPDWFFEKAKYGGILTDIGSHQFEQFLAFTGATDGTVNFARVANFTAPDKPGLEDFGEASLTMNTERASGERAWRPVLRRENALGKSREGGPSPAPIRAIRINLCKSVWEREHRCPRMRFAYTDGRRPGTNFKPET